MQLEASDHSRGVGCLSVADLEAGKKVVDICDWDSKIV